jgi:hypothetical protein
VCTEVSFASPGSKRSHYPMSIGAVWLIGRLRSAHLVHSQYHNGQVVGGAKQEDEGMLYWVMWSAEYMRTGGFRGANNI